MSFMYLKNEGPPLEANQVVSFQTTNVPVATYAPGAKIDSAVTMPVGDYTGKVKIVAGPMTVPHNVTLTVVSHPLFPLSKTITVFIAGPGTYVVPTSRDELIRDIKHITTNKDPQDTLTLSLDAWSISLAGNEAGPNTLAGVTYNMAPSSTFGAKVIVVLGGAAFGIASGSVTAGDKLISAPNGKVKSLGAHTGVDVVGTATESAVDGAVFKINVALQTA